MVVLWAALILSAANDQFSDKKTEGWLDRLFGRVRPEINALMRKSAHVAESGVTGAVAAPVFSNIVSGALRVLAVPPDALPAPALTVVAQSQVRP